MARLLRLLLSASLGMVALVLSIAAAVMLPLYGALMVVWLHIPLRDSVTDVGLLSLACGIGAYLVFRARKYLTERRVDGGGWKLWTSMISLVVVVVVVVVGFALPWHAESSCGLGPPPGAPGFEAHERAQEESRRSLGYLPVCEDYWMFAHASDARSLKSATKGLAFTPVPLDSTPFKDFLVIGGRADQFGGPAGPTLLHRTFRTPQGHVVDLSESDMSVSGGSVKFRADLLKEQVSGAPAQLTVLQAPSGKAVSVLNWVEGRRSYELSISVNVNTTPVHPTLLELANSIPKSTATRPIEEEPGAQFNLSPPWPAR